MASDGLVPRRLLPDSRFNWVYPVDLVVGLVVTLFFLFYFNRVFGRLVAYSVRKYTWYKYRIYVDVQALQFSFLAGRVFFKGFRYHGHNETILINDGYITWRYWLRRVREAECISSLNHKTDVKSGANLDSGLEESVGKKASNGLPCRIKAKVRGIEWFIYNRSPAYDSILEGISGRQPPSDVGGDDSVRKRARLNKANLQTKGQYRDHAASPTEESWSSDSRHESLGKSRSRQAFEPSPTQSTASSMPQSSFPDTEQIKDLPLILRVLPIKLECTRGAIVMGNQHTRSILTAKFDSAVGRVDAQKSSSPLDHYKQLIDLDFKHPVIQLKANRAFKDRQLVEISKRNGEAHSSDDDTQAQFPLQSSRQQRRSWSLLHGILRRFDGSSTSLSNKRARKSKPLEKEEGIPGEHRWLGLTRYMDDEDDLLEQERWKAVEYARFETIVDSPGILISIHWDVPGQVSEKKFATESSHADGDINGSDPPDWSIDVHIRGGEIHYGPWADRQRTDLQNAFFPTLYKDAVPASKIMPGEPRISTCFKLILEVDVATKLILHTREESKDWRWKGHATDGTSRDAKIKSKRHRGKAKEKASLSPEIRPFGWLDLQVMPDSTISFTMDLVARQKGYRNRVDIDLRGPEMASSVNHELLWRSKSQTISCDLSNPLEWNMLRHWYINIQSDDLEVFLLRDHIFLLTDLINDWTSGPPGDFYTFVPFKYSIGFELSNFRLYINANDSNIINNPTDINDNAFIVVWGGQLDADLTIPLEHYQPSRNAIVFKVDAKHGGIDLCTPQWNTQHAFLKDRGVASLSELNITGSYDYATTTSSALTDILRLAINGDSPRICMYGFLIRYFMKIKDNYFGEDLHFRTLEEYKTQVTAKAQNSEGTVDSNQHSKVSNDLDVLLQIAAENATAILPSGLYAATQGIALDIASIRGDLRFTNYYMDLMLTFSPISIAHIKSVTSQIISVDVDSETQVFIDGISLYGHRLFGLPPTEPTYVCNWDFDVGSINGECTPEFLHGFLLGIRCFGFSFDDVENTLPPLNLAIIHDVTFLRVKVRPILIWLRTESAAFRLGLQSLRLAYNDWAHAQSSEKLNVHISELSVAIVDKQDSSLGRDIDSSIMRTQAYLQSTINLRMTTRKKKFEANTEMQQSHIKTQDVRTHRTPWLVQDFREGASQGPIPRTKIRPPAMQFPPMPEPLDREHSFALDSHSTSSISRRTRMSSRSSSRQSSFLANRSRKMTGSATFAGSEISNPVLREDSRTSSSCNHAMDSHPSRRLRGGLAEPDFAPSPYRTPCFPLQGVTVDLEDVPVSSNQVDESDIGHRTKGDSFGLQLQNQEAAKSGIMIDLDPGVRALCTPMALSHMVDLLTRLQAENIDTLLDALQVNTMAEASKSTRGSEEHSPKIMDFNIRIPSLQARFLSQPTHHPPSHSSSSAVSLDVEKMSITARKSKGKVTNEPGTPSDLTSVHVALAKIQSSLSSTSNVVPRYDKLIGCTIQDIVLWCAVGESSSASLAFRNTDVTGTNQSLSQTLPSVFQAVSAVLEAAENRSQMAERHKIRLQILVLSLVIAGEDIPDPPFLTRASYVLRSANNHLRSSDSWKLMARLRHIMQFLPADLLADTTNRCLDHNQACPEDAGNRVAKSLEHWRAWDAVQVKQSLLMHKVYGLVGESPEDRADMTSPLRASIQGGSLRFAIITGPGQNSIVVENLEVAILHNQPAVASGGFIDPETFSLGDAMLQAHCAKITTCLNWELLDLIDAVSAIPFDQLKSKPRSTSEPSAPIRKRKVHVMLSSSISIVDFSSDNLRNMFLCRGLKASILLSQSESRTAANALLSADIATSEVESHSRILIMTKLQRPTLFCSTNSDAKTPKKYHNWKVAASCSSIAFKVLEDPLLIFEVVDLILRDEVPRAVDIAQNVRKRPRQTEFDSQNQVESAMNKVHVTLFVDSYLLSLTILPSLIYRISGEGARTTVQHGLRDASETLINLDLQDHIHAFRTQGKNKSGKIAAMHIPPINGRLSLKSGPRQRSVVFNAIIEAVELDASALHALLVTFSRPEIANLMESIDRELRSIQRSTQRLFGAGDVGAPEKPLRGPLLYDACIIAAGFNVHASSPLSSITAREGQLELNLGCIQAKASNKDGSTGLALPLAEFEIGLDSIQAALKRVEGDTKIPSGEIAVSAFFKCTSNASHDGEFMRAFQLRSNKFNIDVYAETAPIIIDILGHLQNTLKTIDLTAELKTLRSIRRPRVRSAVGTPLPEANGTTHHYEIGSTSLFGAMYSLEMTNIRLSWIVGSSTPMSPEREAEDLILSLSKIDLSTKRDNAARLLIENLQLQMVAGSKVPMGRSQNSALLPEVVFNVAYLSTGKDRRLAFQAAGKSLDLRLTSQFILPASDLRRSIAFAIHGVRTATADWKASAAAKGNQTRQLLGDKKFASILVDADFAGAVVYLEGRNVGERQTSAMGTQDGAVVPRYGRYNQFNPENTSSSTTLRSPGLAFKIEYRNNSIDQESLNAEIKVDGSNNTLYPRVVPLIMEISSSVKEMMGESDQLDQSPKAQPAPPKLVEDDRLRSADPSTIFGKTKVNFGLRICKQEFSLSCQPMAKVAATARFEDIYVTLNTIQSSDHGQFFTVSALFTNPEISVKHTYSREPTGSLAMDSIYVSLMSSKHVSAATGLSAILKIGAAKAQVNARQMQDVLLFREVWIPPEMRRSPATSAPPPSSEPQAFIVQRYQQVAAAGAFPWDATISITELDVRLDLGQSLGRSTLNISNFWVSSKKTSNWEQNLYLGCDRAGMDATGRMSGLIELQALKVRTSIKWPMENVEYHTPLVQASLGFDHLRVKAAFDYQAFAIMNITGVEVMMYNVRDLIQATGSDRLVAVVEGDTVQVFCTATSASQGLALYQAIQRLIEEKQAAYEASLKETERFLSRKSTTNTIAIQKASNHSLTSDREEIIKVPIRLQTKVVVKLRAVHFGVFPSTFFDNQIFKVEARDASARFSVVLDHGKVHSTLGMTLGQLRVALSGVSRPTTPRKVGEVAIDEVAASAAASRGGLILAVPRTVVSMQVWQLPESNQIDYLFRSSFEGNIDVGWNYSRISFIRGMHGSHVRALAQRLGKPLPQSALQITGGLNQDNEDGGGKTPRGEQEKITAVVTVPQSKYDYTALQPALIDTPQLRNLGEATPPLEWIGLHRERLPNLTHQIVIVSLLEVAKEVEDAYTKILGSSSI
ncbi:MAG: hypothetical protein HETSPECPRED_009247 [Heterodermia speciosa]|uniref:Elongation factor 2 n=1 Tax=Heterodermia speciosa TaxID=116794 RepID=A0A8H3G1F8_9LECA|nr:MAG: hypothetical protein HETSPECPRED_009247 [Heterodermia speciosa]